MHITPIEQHSDDFFKTAKKLENHDGRWRYFKFASADRVKGVFETKQKIDGSLRVHPDFFKYFLGLFTPSLKNELCIHQEKTFLDFCTKLNSLLEEKKEVYDLSSVDLWIWAEGADVTVPKQLSDFLNFK